MDKISFIDTDTQKQINAPLNGTLITGTHRMCDLIPAMLEAIRDTAEYAQLSSRLPSVVTDPSASEWDDRWQDDDVAYLYEELTDILERYAPEGYYFGAHPGDGSDFGYWRDESYMLGVITESVKEGQPFLLGEDNKLSYNNYAGENLTVNANQLIRREGGVMVGDKSHMVNINDLDEDSVQKLYEAVKESKAKNITAKEALKELLPNSGIDFVINSGKPYEIRMQDAVAHISAVHAALLPAEARGKEVYLYGSLVKEDGSTQPLNYLEDLPVSAQNQLVQYVKDALAKIDSPGEDVKKPTTAEKLMSKLAILLPDDGDSLKVYRKPNKNIFDPAYFEEMGTVTREDGHYLLYIGNVNAVDVSKLSPGSPMEDFTYRQVLREEILRNMAVGERLDNMKSLGWRYSYNNSFLLNRDGFLVVSGSYDSGVKDAYGDTNRYIYDWLTCPTDILENASKEVSERIIKGKDFPGLKAINDKLRNLLPDYGDHIFINERFNVQRPDKNVRVVNVTHSLLVDTNEDVFVCGTTNGGFRLEGLTSDELLQLDNILNEKKYKILVSSNKEKALAERYHAAGMGNGTQFWPDRGTLGAYQAFAFKNNKILVFKDADDSKGVMLSSLPYEEQKRFMDAIGTLLDRHLASKAAKQAVHDRIVHPYARFFLPDQIEVLNRYHQLVAPDKPAGEVFRDLLNEVAQESDVARKPDKWVTDTAKELDDLAEGITREESRGLRK